MQGLIILALLVAMCLAVTGGETEEFERDFGGLDVFQAINISPSTLRDKVAKPTSYFNGHLVSAVHGPSEIDKLEDFLKEKTNSEDPIENLNIFVESLNTDSKNKSPSKTGSNDAKRLVAALSTLKGENLCNYYGFRIIKNNLNALSMSLRPVGERSSIAAGWTSTRPWLSTGSVPLIHFP